MRVVFKIARLTGEGRATEVPLRIDIEPHVETHGDGRGLAGLGLDVVVRPEALGNGIGAAQGISHQASAEADGASPVLQAQ